MSTPAGIAVVVPIKSFTAAKARLAEVLSPAARAALARQCAHTVLTAAGSLPVFVVCDDDTVAAWAREHGASVVQPPQPGLNVAAASGRLAARAAGFARVIVVHSDLPQATDLASLAERAVDVVIVPDRHGDGTNALLLPTAGDFSFCYGPGSSAAHQAQARTVGLRYEVVERPDLALDLDTLDDLRVAGIASN